MQPPSSRVPIAAPPGERNVLEVVREPAGTWLIRDSGAVLTAATTCIALAAERRPLVEVSVTLIEDGGAGRGDYVAFSGRWRVHLARQR